MTITDKEFIKLVCEKTRYDSEKLAHYVCDEPACGRNIECKKCSLSYAEYSGLDYNILMPAVGNINDGEDWRIKMDDNGWIVSSSDPLIDGDFFHKEKYNNSMLLALQHALLYIMENEI